MTNLYTWIHDEQSMTSIEAQIKALYSVIPGICGVIRRGDLDLQENDHSMFSDLRLFLCITHKTYKIVGHRNTIFPACVLVLFQILMKQQWFQV
jgi:hypothetical protein